jgi:polysaccharide export outer membrane protein
MNKFLGCILLGIFFAATATAQISTKTANTVRALSATEALSPEQRLVRAASSRTGLPAAPAWPGGRPLVPPPASSPASSLSTAITAAPVRLSPGDLLDVTVFEVPELMTRVRVNSEGLIGLPLIGKLAVGGLSPDQAEAAIRQKLMDSNLVKDPQVAVFVAEYANQAVYVLGEVTRPGAYPVLGAHRLFDFISAAGGLTPRAGTSIRVKRSADDTQLLIRFSKASEFPEDNPEISAGDTIVVAPAGIVYVVGNVLKPGGFLLDRDERMTILQALALAEGLKPNSSLNAARLIRKTDQGREEIRVNLKEILNSSSEDLTLKDEDILYVPDSAARTAAKRGLEGIVQTAIGIAIYRR